MPRILLQFICAITFYLLANLGQVKAQSYQNEWIKYGLTYFKFKISQDGLYRIDQPTLARLGLSQVPVAQFSLWRNGIEIPLYTSTHTVTPHISALLLTSHTTLHKAALHLTSHNKPHTPHLTHHTSHIQ